MRIFIPPFVSNEQEKWFPVSREIKWFVFNYFHLADIYRIPITHQSPGDPRVKYKQKSCSYGSKNLPYP